MIILLSGTPGTGKTTVSKILAKKINFKILEINEILDNDIIIKKERDTRIVDIEKLNKKIMKIITENTIVVGHFSHLLDIEGMVIILRTDPKELRKRLKEKGFNKSKIEENLEAEALDVCLIEAIEKHRDVYEIDTTNKNPEEVAEEITEILKGKGRKYKPGKIDWSYYILEKIIKN